MKKAIKRILSVFLTIVMIATTFFIFDPEVITVKAAAAWTGSTSATSGTDYTRSGTTTHIKTPNGLAWFVSTLGNHQSDTVYLDADMDLGGSSYQWVRNGTAFKGIFDGQNHTISNMYASCGYRDDRAGLFMLSQGATMRNVRFSNCFVGTTDSGYGKDTWYGQYALCFGYNESSACTVSNITVTNCFVSGRTRLGALVGETVAGATISSCTVACRIDGVRKSGNGDDSKSYDQGGMIGRCSGTVSISGCTYSNTSYGGTTSGNTGRQTCGGMIGRATGGTVTITNCLNNASISTTGDDPYGRGGMIGETNATTTITNCSNAGTISGNGDHCGGLVGYDNGVLTISGKHSSKSYTNEGTISSTSSYVGGICGYCQQNNTKFSYCTNNGTVTGTSSHSVGGIAGRYDSDNNVYFEHCYNYKKIQASAQYAAGICGYNKGFGNFTDCHNSGEVYTTGSGYSGGICGEIQDEQRLCSRTGSGGRRNPR